MSGKGNAPDKWDESPIERDTIDFPDDDGDEPLGPPQLRVSKAKLTPATPVNAADKSPKGPGN